MDSSKPSEWYKRNRKISITKKCFTRNKKSLMAADKYEVSTKSFGRCRANE